jgi:hypothetical protein
VEDSKQRELGTRNLFITKAASSSLQIVESHFHLISSTDIKHIIKGNGKMGNQMDWANCTSKMAHILRVPSLTAKLLAKMVFTSTLMGHSREELFKMANWKAEADLCQDLAISFMMGFGKMISPTEEVYRFIPMAPNMRATLSME